MNEKKRLTLWCGFLAALLLGGGWVIAGWTKKPQPHSGKPLQSTSAPCTACSLNNPTNLDDPARDGWSTERFNQQANAQFHKLARFLTLPNLPSQKDLATIAQEKIQCGTLRPTRMCEIYQDKSFTIRRAIITPSAMKVGCSELRRALEHLTTPWKDRRHLHIKFKLYHIEKTNSGILTRQYVSLDGPTTSGYCEVNATWECHWTQSDSESLPLLDRIAVVDFEEISTSEPRLLGDCSQAALHNNHSAVQQLQRGTEHWGNRLTFIDHNGYYGLALGDVNGDGREDLYVCQSGGLPNRLFIHGEDNTLNDISKKAKVDFLDLTRSALFVDLDNDGDQDLVVGTRSALLLMENDGSGSFTIRAHLAKASNAFSLTAVDYDNDGDLDLYVCRYYSDGKKNSTIPYPLPYHDANNGGNNVLLQNEGKWTFLDGTKKVGLDVNNRRFSLAACWEDYDNDGDQDLYVANDFGRNNLYRNDSGRFVDVAEDAGVVDQSFGMSATWADVNHDGWMDLYVSNMFSSAGNRVTNQQQFQRGQSKKLKKQLRYLARGNSLFVNTGTGRFQDQSAKAKVGMGRWSWGSKFVDLNNDGWEDLVVTNGYLTRESSGDL